MEWKLNSEMKYKESNITLKMHLVNTLSFVVQLIVSHKDLQVAIS